MGNATERMREFLSSWTKGGRAPIHGSTLVGEAETFEQLVAAFEKDSDWMTKEVEEIMSNLLCSAFEGGSNYWCTVKDLVYPEGKTKKDFTYIYELPFHGGAVKIKADGEKGIFTLDRKALEKGWLTMRDEISQHWADAISEMGDATTGDVFLQACLFGKIVFG